MSIDTTQNARATTHIDVAIGLNLRSIRLHRKVSQEDLGKRLGISFQGVQRYERGLSRIALSRAVDIADALDCSVTDLLKDVTDPVPDDHDFWSKITKVSDQRILHAYQAIACPKQRQALLDLAKTLANAED